ncbi:hypothetical protein HAZELMIKA_22 [Klebsiella phage vB_KaeD_HazelMika]|nr:hypothetical protein HAZELMIKA_22 [Klebsiella phage vB_KaeD_HazelMika]
MKKIMLSALFLLPLNAMALNINIGYPVDASRLSLTGEVAFNLDCKNKEITIQESSNVIFDKHLLKNVSVMCYKDQGKYSMKFAFGKGKMGRDDMIASQTSRYLPDPNKII